MNNKINTDSSKHGTKHCFNPVTLSDQAVQGGHIDNVK